MSLWLQRLREDEEGQTLVLAAIFGLILMLCVLGTVNLGRAVYDKVQLQTAADAAAYSQAAVEARVLNFTAYTNRAMVVHYASIMAASAYLTWIHYMYGGVKPILTVLKYVPYLGAVINVIDNILKYLVIFLDYAVAIVTPLLSAANIVLYGLQEGAWWSTYLGRLSGLPPEAHSGDSTAHPYTAIWPARIPAANQAVFAQTRGSLFMPKNTFDTAQILINAKSDAVQEARLHMLEVANSARNPWVAYGDRMGNPSLSPLARHSRWKVLCAQAGTIARTELGGFQPGGGIIGSITKLPAQVWSGQGFQLAVDCKIPIIGIHYKDRLRLFQLETMDQLFAGVTPFKESDYQVLKAKGIIGKIIAYLLGGTGVFAYVKQQAESTKPNPNLRLFWLSPYVYFAPRGNAKAGLGPAGALGNFAQPDVLVGLAKQRVDYNQELGAQKYFGRRFSINSGPAGSKGSVDFNYEGADTPKIPGLNPLHTGLNAFAAAQVYYHRPGDWHEMPNFFNPLWSARLMPVLESNVAAKLGVGKIAALQSFVLH